MNVFKQQLQSYVKTKGFLHYFLNLLRIKPKEGAKMGKISDIDGTTYEASEILFHTPSEHTILGERYPLEVQIVHRAIAGTMR